MRTDQLEFEVVWNGVNDGRNGDLMPSTRRVLEWREERQAGDDRRPAAAPAPPPSPVVPGWRSRTDAQSSAMRVMEVLLHAEQPLTFGAIASKSNRTTTTVRPIVEFLRAQGRVVCVTPQCGPKPGTYAIVTDHVS